MEHLQGTLPVHVVLHPKESVSLPGIISVLLGRDKIALGASYTLDWEWNPMRHGQYYWTCY